MSSAVLEAAGTAASPGRRRHGGLGALGYLGALIMLAYFSVASDSFLTASNLVTIAGQAAVYAIAGFGLAIVVIVGGDDVVNGGIDLSIGAIAGLTGAVTAVLLGDGISAPVAIVAGLVAGLVVGGVNATAVVLGVRPLLTTLATAAAAGSLALVITGNAKVVVERASFVSFRDADLLGVPASVLVLALVYVVVAVVMGRTPWGVACYAVGQNPTAARVAGISPRRYVAASYLVAALLGGLAGVLFVVRLSAAVPDLGDQILLDVLLTTFISVVFSRRLTVTVTGVLVGALFVTALSSGFTQVGLDSQWVGVVKGVLILGVLAITAIRPGGGR
ncbi:MAG: ABC transporter permease [Nocardioidaceae bacterium]